VKFFATGLGLVLEAGARTGFLTGLLNKAGVPTIAVDNEFGGFEGRTSKYWEVAYANYTEIPLDSYKAVILSWPNYGSQDAATLLGRMKTGQVLVYQGEGMFGCCADDSFFQELESPRWKELESVSDSLNDRHVRFTGTHDWWKVFVRT
jgi:hypothetical protein